MSSYTDIPLPLRIEGSASQMVVDLEDVYKRAKHVTIISYEGVPGMLVATIGMSHLEENLDSFRVFSDTIDLVAQEDLSPIEIHRLGFLGARLESVYQMGKMSVEMESPCECTSARVLLADSSGNMVVLNYVGEMASPDLQVDLNWSFGDPQKRVELLHSAVGAQATSDREQAGQPIGEWLKAMPFVPPFAESFTGSIDEDDDPLAGVRLHEHQRVGVDNWKERDWKGIFNMCTGAGKTIAALAGVVELGRSFENPKDRPVTFISVPTQILADQWIRIIRGFNLGDCLSAFRSSSNWVNNLEPWVAYPDEGRCRFVVTTYATFADERFGSILNRLRSNGSRALWIADEMHNLSSIRLRERIRALGEFFEYRLGLSATPEIEGNEAATKQLLEFFGENPKSPSYCASYELADGIRDGVLCRYRYYPVPAYLDQEKGSRYLEILRGLQAAGNSSASMELYEERRKFLRSSGAQLQAFQDNMQEWQTAGNLERCLVYCPPGGAPIDAANSENEHDSDDEQNLLEQVVGAIQNKHIPVCSILGGTSQAEREQTLRRFAQGEVKVLCAIACLDEGVDVPEIQTAIVLYSVDRAKQFIQRRGRILRIPAHNTDKVAVIYDIILLPHGSQLTDGANQALFEREMRRYREFAGLAENGEEAQRILDEALQVVENVEENEELKI